MKITPKTVLFIIGPTAVGKSELAFHLAQELGGEIISADSMQVYRGMDIGTGKPSKQEQKKVRHHLIDVCSPSRAFSVFDFHQRAVKAIFEIQDRKKIPIIAGGTGFYIRALLDGLEPSPPPDPKLRRKLETELRKKGLNFLVKKLAKIAPKKAQEIDVRNPRRVLRALEVALLAKKNWKTKQLPVRSISKLGLCPVVIGVLCEREKLYCRINERVEFMFAEGWIREVKRLVTRRFSKTAKQAIGYSRILPLLRKKKLKKPDFPALIDQVKTDTRRYAKRQLTWFRQEKVSFWLEAPEPGMGRILCQTALTRLQ